MEHSRILGWLLDRGYEDAARFQYSPRAFLSLAANGIEDNIDFIDHVFKARHGEPITESS